MPNARRSLATAVGLAMVLLAGCADRDDAPTLTSRATTLAVPETPEWAGLRVRGTMGEDDGRLVVQAMASNAGNVTYEVEAGCTDPWSAHVVKDGQRHEAERPQPQCLDFATREMPPGEQLAFEASWGGAYWDADAGRMVEAAPGEYAFSARFVAYHPDGARIKAFDLDFPVTVS